VSLLGKHITISLARAQCRMRHRYCRGAATPATAWGAVGAREAETPHVLIPNTTNVWLSPHVGASGQGEGEGQAPSGVFRRGEQNLGNEGTGAASEQRV